MATTLNSTIRMQLAEKSGKSVAECILHSATYPDNLDIALCSSYPQADDLPEGLLHFSEDDLASDTYPVEDSDAEYTANQNWTDSLCAKYPQAEDLPDGLTHLSMDDALMESDGFRFESFYDSTPDIPNIGDVANSHDNLSHKADQHALRDPSWKIASLHCSPATDLPSGLCTFGESENSLDTKARKNSSLKSLSKRVHAKSKDELLAGASRAAEGQELNMALSDLAELAVQELPLMVFERELYLRVRTIWVHIDEFDLAYELGNHEQFGLIASLGKRSRTELYQRVLMIPSIQCEADELRNDPSLIPCIDGIFDTRTMCPRQVSSRDHFFSSLNISAYEIGKGHGDTFEAFVHNLSAGDRCVRQRLLEIIGVILSGYMPKSFYVFIGPHDTGKSQVANLLRRLIGDKGVGSISDPNILSANFGFSMIPGKKLCYCPDAAEIPLSQGTVAAIKQVTGGDLLHLNRKYKEPVTFVNEAKLLFVSNHQLHGAIDDAMKQRAVVLPFQNSVPPSKQIPNLSDRLYDERGYIVYQAILALKELVSRDFEYTPVAGEDIAFSNSRTAPSGSEDSFGVRSFVLNCCILQEDARTATSALYAAYQVFCDTNGYAACKSSAVFSRYLRQCYPDLQEANTAQARGVKGIKLCTGIDSAESDFQ